MVKNATTLAWSALCTFWNAKPADRLPEFTPVQRGNIVNRHEECKTMLQKFITVNVNLPMAHPTQSPEVTHLYSSAAQSLKENNANLAPEFNDHGTRIPSLTKRKRIVNSQTNQTRAPIPSELNTSTKGKIYKYITGKNPKNKYTENFQFITRKIINSCSKCLYLSSE